MRMSINKDTNPQFGKKETSKVVFSSNGKVREFRVHAGLFVAVGALFTMFMVGYVGATAYLAFRDDLVSASFINQTRMKHEYEDRIAALRSKVDRITSRQLLDQQAVEAKVAALMRQQEMLSGRSGELQGIFERARQNGVGSTIPVPQKSPQKAEINTLDTTTTASIGTDQPQIFAGAGGFLRGSSIGTKSGNPLALEIPQSQALTASSGIFTGVLDQINEVAIAQRAQVLALQSQTHQKSAKLASLFSDLNVPLPSAIAENIGGPFVPDANVEFDDLTDGLVEALDLFEGLKGKARKLPVGNPLPGAAISSSFGKRVDPFHRKSAFHSGIDFKAKSGTPVLASGSGKVIKAGRNGGYGLMVEIDHGHGITTRYAHLSKILVKAGARVSDKQKIGRVGSTGRSTGPHLHYEVRRNAKASNPKRFLKVGKKIKELL